MGLTNGPNWSVWLSSVLFQPCSNPFQICFWCGGLFSLSYHILANFGNFLPILEPLGRFFFFHYFNLKKAPPGPSSCPLWCSNLVPPLPTQNWPFGPISVAKKLFSAYLGHFLGPLGPHLEFFWSGKWAKLVSLNVLSAVLTLFQHSFSN